MKSRELLTTPVLIVSNYSITPYQNGRFLHRFTPETTGTVYQFIANQERLLEEGERYNIGYTVDNGTNWVDMAATAKATDVDPAKSHYVAKILGEQLRDVETEKSKSRVVHQPIEGCYLGKKYAWRIYGMAIGRDTFDAYLKAIQHPSVPCYTEGSPSIAYQEDGLAAAMDALIQSLQRKGSNRFESPLLPSKKWFLVKGISGITDKK